MKPSHINYNSIISLPPKNVNRKSLHMQGFKPLQNYCNIAGLRKLWERERFLYFATASCKIANKSKSRLRRQKVTKKKPCPHPPARFPASLLCLYTVCIVLIIGHSSRGWYHSLLVVVVQAQENPLCCRIDSKGGDVIYLTKDAAGRILGYLPTNLSLLIFFCRVETN